MSHSAKPEGISLIQNSSTDGVKGPHPLISEQEIISSKLTSWSRDNLKNILKSRNIKFRSNFRKRELHDALVRHVLTKKYESVNGDKVKQMVIKIQSTFRGWTLRNNIKLRGLAFINRSLCNNDIDPISLMDIAVVPDALFFSYRANDGRYYGFDIRSLKNMFDHNQTKNPFNREEFPIEVHDNCILVWDSLNRSPLWKSGMKGSADDNNDREHMGIARRAFRVFHDLYLITGIDVDHNWFLELDRRQCIEMYGRLHDHWVSLSLDDRRRLNPANTRWFRHHDDIYLLQNFNLQKVQSSLISEFERMISSPSEQGDKITLVYWILIALTKVSRSAEMGMPLMAV